MNIKHNICAKNGHDPDRVSKYLWIGAFCVCVMCGCTKKEQLVLPEERKEPVASERAEPMGTGEVNDRTADPADGISPAEETDGAVLPEAADGAEEAVSETGIYVHICGAVNNPGVFVLPAGSRVFDAVEAAGGFAEDASADYINQAQVTTDGCKIRIPTTEEAEALSDGQEDTAAFLIQGDPNAAGFPAQGEADKTADRGASDAAGKVNINTADTAQLCTVNGIGESRAAAIIRYRESHGAFKSIEEIMQVDGIKQGVFEKIRDQISVK